MNVDDMGMSLNKSKCKAIQHDLMMKTDVGQLFVSVCQCICLSCCLCVFEKNADDMGLSLYKSKGKAMQHDLMMKTDVSWLNVIVCVFLSLCLSVGRLS